MSMNVSMTEKPQLLTKQEFKQGMLNNADNIIMNRKRRIRHKQLDQINFKLHGDFRFKEKNEFFEFQIENLISQFNTKTLDQQELGQEYLTQLRRKLMKMKVKNAMGQLNHDEFQAYLAKQKLKLSFASNKRS